MIKGEDLENQRRVFLLAEESRQTAGKVSLLRQDIAYVIDRLD